MVIVNARGDRFYCLLNLAVSAKQIECNIPLEKIKSLPAPCSIGSGSFIIFDEKRFMISFSFERKWTDVDGNISVFSGTIYRIPGNFTISAGLMISKLQEKICPS